MFTHPPHTPSNPTVI